MKQEEWISAHLFYSQSLDFLLVNGVAPTVEKLIVKKLILNYFFIRYNEGGPHIRLRLKVFRTHKEKVRKIIEGELLKFFMTYPSQPLQQIEKYNGKFYPMNSIQFIAYEPEIKRYGGAIGITIAEQFFEASSKIVLSILREKKIITYDEAISIAIQLNVALTASLNLNLQDGLLFYHTIFSHMLPTARAVVGHKTFEEIVDDFENEYLLQKTKLIDFFSNFIQYVYSEKTKYSDDNWIDTWLKYSKLISKLFYSELRQNRIETQQYNIKVLNSKINKAEYKPEWSIFSSYVHMSNNRLGLMNCDESYIAYLVYRTLMDTSNCLNHGH